MGISDSLTTWVCVAYATICVSVRNSGCRCTICLPGAHILVLVHPVHDSKSLSTRRVHKIKSLISNTEFCVLSRVVLDQKTLEILMGNLSNNLFAYENSFVFLIVVRIILKPDPK